METKLLACHLEGLSVVWLGMHGNFKVDQIGLGGGIVIFWKLKVDFTI